MSFEIDHLSSTYASSEAIHVRCRIYRPWGDWTQEIFKGSLIVPMANYAPLAKYVRWSHVVYWEKRSQWITEQRRSDIHRTDARRCAFGTPNVKGSIEQMQTLPFALSEIQAHRDDVCDYCFFGGPDKSTLRRMADELLEYRDGPPAHQ